MFLFCLLFNRERFWENLTTPLFGTLAPPSENTEVCLALSGICSRCSASTCFIVLFPLSALRFGDLRLRHEDHRPGDLLRRQVISTENPTRDLSPSCRHGTNLKPLLRLGSGSLEPSLKDGLRKFANARRYEYWSHYVKSLVCHVAEMEEEGICYFAETQMLISAWRMLLILSTGHVGRLPNAARFFPAAV